VEATTDVGGHEKEAVAEKKMGKNRRKKEMMKKRGEDVNKSLGHAKENGSEHGEGDDRTAQPHQQHEKKRREGGDETKREEEDKEDSMEAELEKLERELEDDRVRFVQQFASFFTDLAVAEKPQ
jgi:hypothetical protein